MSNKNFVKTIALPYAEALIELTSTLQDNSEFVRDVETIYQVLSESEELRHFLSNPLVNKQSKKIVISRLFTEQIHNILINFLFIVIDKNRVSFLKEILQLYFELSLSTKSSKLVHVYTVRKLNLEQQQALMKKLEILTGSRTVQLDVIIDPSLIAGLILKVNSKVIDVSLYGQLQSMAVFLQTN